MEVAAPQAKGRAAVIAGAGARTTTACVSLATHAQKVGCDGVLIEPASYWPLTQDEVCEHFAKVSARIDIPICVYNNPWFTGFDMKPEFLAELAKLRNITCVKESSSDLTRITSIRLLTNGSFSIMVGWETSVLQAFAAVADGWASVCSNFAPKMAKDLFLASTSEANPAGALQLWETVFHFPADFVAALRRFVVECWVERLRRALHARSLCYVSSRSLPYCLIHAKTSMRSGANFLAPNGAPWELLC